MIHKHLSLLFKALGSILLLGLSSSSTYAVREDIIVGQDYNNWEGFYNRAAYYDVKADGTKQPGQSRNANFNIEWFNLNNDDFIDVYSANAIWLGNSSYAYTANNCVWQYPLVNLQSIDINGDGRWDLKTNASKKPEEVLMYIRGKFYPVQMSLLSVEEYLGEQEKLTLHTGQGLGSGVSFVGGSSNAENFSGTKVIDFNGDGYTDFMDAASGLIYQNVGGGRYVLNETGGQLTFRDFNHDGMMDYVLFDSEKKETALFLSKMDGTWDKQVLVSNLYSDKDITCYDFDKDGDVDILVTLSRYVIYNRYTHDNGGSFVLLMENQGHGLFKQHEFSLEGTLYFRQCMDINGDGHYEIVAQKKIDGAEDKQTELVYYTIKGTTITDTPTLLKGNSGAIGTHNTVAYPFLLADLNNSGYTHILYNGGTGEIPNALPNTRPVSPNKPDLVYDAAKGTIKVEWNKGSDAECSEADLTYALRIGSAEGKGDLLFAHALPDGRRRNLLEGNCGYAQSRVLDVSSWPAGKYYISVQSIDPGCLGSVFSPYAIFEKKEPAADFIFSHNQYFSVGDTCTVVLLGEKETGCSYDWDWDGGTVLSQSDNEGVYKIMFKQGGEKHIALKVTTNSGTFARVEHVLNVNLGNIKTHDFGIGKKVDGVSLAIDLDEDGKMEVYLNYDNKFYEGNDSAQYSTIKKIWNSNLPFGPDIVADVNHDGSADLVGYSPKESYLLQNKGDKQMEVSSLAANEYNWNFYDNPWHDFNNDGLLEPLYYKNTGDYATFENVENSYYQHISNYETGYTFDPEIIIDYDRDGLVDFIDCSYYAVYNQPSVALFRNNGDFTFTPEILNDKKWESTGNRLLEDLNGDGLWDYIHYESYTGHGNTWYSDHIDIQWGDGDSLKIPAEKGLAFGFIETITDVDNNGCLDLIFNTSNSEHLVIYFNRDRSYKIEVTDNVDAYGANYLLTDGRLAYGSTVFSGIKNTKPAAPGQIRAAQDDRFITLTWNHSSDNETPNALMRYNISICRKGETGAGAYLFSPLNAAKNGVHVPSPSNLLNGNMLKIPVQNIPAGEYEVKVQGIDRGMLESDFSEAFHLKVMENALIDMPVSTGIGCKVTVKILDNSGQTIDFGTDSSVKKHADGSYTVIWNSEGRKTVKVGSLASQDIYVYPLPQGNFSLPEQVLLGAKIDMEGVNLNQGTWTYTWNGSQQLKANEHTDVNIKPLDADHAIVTFNKAGKYELFHQVSDDFNTETFTVTTEVNDENPAPAISLVDIDTESNYFRVNWNAEVLPVGSQSFHIYKETSRYNEYELLANIPITENSFVDSCSMPDYSTSRYRISCVLPYGETMVSEAHQPIHVMINKGVGNTWNLVWTRYEGQEIESYRILGGNTIDHLNVIAEVSGHATSYSELDATPGTKYYAVETVLSSKSETKMSVHAKRETTACRSNVVSTDNATSLVLAQQISILSDKKDMVIDGSTGDTMLQLMARIYPLNATLKQLNWQLVDGHDIATLSSSGLLKAKSEGSVTVRAYAVDGSGVYGEVQVNMTNLTAIEQIKAENDRTHLKVTLSNDRLTICGLPEDQSATLYIYNTSGCLMKAGQVSGTNATLDCGKILPGVYLCRVVTDQWTETIRFLKY